MGISFDMLKSDHSYPKVAVPPETTSFSLNYVASALVGRLSRKSIRQRSARRDRTRRCMQFH
jgi:hypothetical protein